MKLYGTINLSKIPQNLIWDSKDGKMITINIFQNDNPKFDQDYVAIAYVPKAMRAEGQKAVYIGNFESEEHYNARVAAVAAQPLPFQPAAPIGAQAAQQPAPSAAHATPFNAPTPEDF